MIINIIIYSSQYLPASLFLYNSPFNSQRSQLPRLLLFGGPARLSVTNELVPVDPLVDSRPLVLRL